MDTMTRRYENRDVLAGAYAASNPKSMLTHIVEVDENGTEIKVLCRGVKLDNLCDRFGSGPVPTCPRCIERLAKITK